MQKHKDSSGFRRLTLLLGLFFPLCISAQQINVKGIVKDAFGDGIPGASVVIKGTTNGTTADVDGKFSLKVSPDAQLVFSCVSYVTVEENVASREYLEIVL